MVKMMRYCIPLFMVCFLVSCSKESEKVEDNTYSGSFRYYGGDYNAVQADFRERTYTIVNPKWGQAGEPFQIELPGYEVNLWSHPAGSEILLTLQVNGRSAGRYAAGRMRQNGCAISMYEKGSVFKRMAEGNGDSCWVEFTKVDLSQKLVSGKFYSIDKSLISGGSDYYAVTKGEFNNVKLQ